MRILALEPFYAGSHRQFLDGWIEHSNHDWTVLGLPGHKWKWRMRHAPITFADQVRKRFTTGERWDAIFCSDMLHLGEFLSLAPVALRQLPTTVYFHENQFTYPTRNADPRDHHFAFTNYVTALTSERAWFNSQFHKDEFLTALEMFLKRMPDNQSLANVRLICEKSVVQYPGIELPTERTRCNSDQPMTILWSSRWEHDKNPEVFFEAMRLLIQRGRNFQVIVLGESFHKVPDVFRRSKEFLHGRCLQWGFVESREKYFELLSRSDVIVSTALHEFFGLSVVEAISAGVRPLLPRRLSYPEIIRSLNGDPNRFLYEGGASEIANRLCEIADEREPYGLAGACEKFHWKTRAAEMDREIGNRRRPRVHADQRRPSHADN